MFAVWWRKHRLLHIHRNRDKQKKTARVSIRRDLPTACRHPRAPQDLPYHPTQREEEVEGREREKTGHRCEARRTQPHRQDEKTIQTDVTLMATADCDVSGRDLRDGFIPATAPACCVGHKLSEIRLSTRISSNSFKNVISIPLVGAEDVSSHHSLAHSGKVEHMLQQFERRRRGRGLQLVSTASSSTPPPQSLVPKASDL